MAFYGTRIQNIHDTRITESYVIVEAIFIMFMATSVHSQGDSSFTFPNFSPVIAGSLDKIFSTSLVVVTANQSQTFNETIFTNAANSFYTQAFDGFESINIIARELKTNTTNEVSYRVEYNISYNYPLLNVSSDSTVLTTIGTVSAVKTGLESNALFSEEYSVLEDQSNFSLAGNALCNLVSCGSSQVFCNETELGLSPTCISICFNKTVCQNGASCVHSNPAQAPSCNCVGAMSVWYIGQYCEYKVEVWMVAVFVLCYLLVIAVILVIGCLCWRKVGKPKKQSYPVMVPAKPSGPRNEKTPVGREDARQPGENAANGNRTQRKPEARSPLPSILEERSAVQISDEGLDARARRASSDEEGSDERLTSSLSSSGSEEQEGKPYNVLHYDTDSQVAESRYDNLETTGSKSTQTKTRIDVHLPDSILARNIT